MIEIIDNIGFYNIIFPVIIIGFLILYITNRFQINLFKDNKRNERLILITLLITLLILLLFLFIYHLNSYEALQFNPYKLSEQEQIQYLKNYIIRTENRNHNIIASFFILISLILINIIPKKEK